MPKQKMQKGFSLIEILLSLVFIGAIVTILFTTSGSLFTRRASNIQSIAAKVATKQIETMRGDSQNVMINKIGGLNCENLGDSNNKTVVIPADPDTNSNVELTMITTISCFEDAASSEIVNVNVEIQWINDNGGQRNLVMDTIISDNGL